ncbi:uncharacterized protein PAC_12204 [Phialocephala subalpina]|uniref:Uncharacterized protein n=1 Tax=Phialocephala subalpina TaxID=576137 RepID=A0A1L7XBG0_9HELO|nr:uncharacterized protein PAC_12204 [Phialocephala subalpina]
MDSRHLGAPPQLNGFAPHQTGRKTFSPVCGIRLALEAPVMTNFSVAPPPSSSISGHYLMLTSTKYSGVKQRQTRTGLRHLPLHVPMSPIVTAETAANTSHTRAMSSKSPVPIATREYGQDKSTFLAQETFKNVICKVNNKLWLLALYQDDRVIQAPYILLTRLRRSLTMMLTLRTSLTPIMVLPAIILSKMWGRINFTFTGAGIFAMMEELPKKLLIRLPPTWCLSSPGILTTWATAMIFSFPVLHPPQYFKNQDAATNSDGALSGSPAISTALAHGHQAHPRRTPMVEPVLPISGRITGCRPSGLLQRQQRGGTHDLDRRADGSKFQTDI